MKYPEHLTTLINMLKRLPGVGNKTAERYAFQMLEWTPQNLKEISTSIGDLKEKTKYCTECGYFTEEYSCFFCVERRIQTGIICIVPSIREVFAIESTGEYKGTYHILGGLLSPMEGIGPEVLSTEKLIERIQKHGFKEAIIGIDSTLEGDATALFLKKELLHLQIKVSRLAFGIPMGSSLDYVDGNTLARSFLGRNTI